MNALKIAFALTVCLSSLNAQRTWIVSNSGPGDFTDIPPAVAAASPGDTICVRGYLGGYKSTSTNKGLTIIGYGHIWPTGLFTVHDLPRGQRFVFQGFLFNRFNTNIALHFRDNLGTVHVEACWMTSGNIHGQPRAFVKIDRCADVSFNASVVYDLEITDSRVTLVDTAVSSTDDRLNVAPLLGTAMVMTNSRVTLSNSLVNGGPQDFSSVAPPGIRMTGGELRIAGTSDLDSRIQGGAGTLPFGVWNFGPPILAKGGHIILDPDVPLLMSNGQSAKIQGTATVTLHDTPYVTTWTIVPVLPFKPKIYHLPGSVAGLVMGLPIQPRPFLFGELWLDPNMMFSIGAGTLTGSGTEGSLEFTFNVPSGLFPKDILLSFQAIVLHQGKAELSVGVRVGVF